MREQPGDPEVVVGYAAKCLGVSGEEVWRLINTGELTMSETENGLWAIPDWSLKYFLSHRDKAEGTETKPLERKAVPHAPVPQKKRTRKIKKDKRGGPALKWKRYFDELGKQKNALGRRIRDERRVGDAPASARRVRL